MSNTKFSFFKKDSLGHRTRLLPLTMLFLSHCRTAKRLCRGLECLKTKLESVRT